MPRVLVIDNDPSILELMTAILSDEGYAVATLLETTHAAVAAAVGRQEPDCVLLDGRGDGADGTWTEAAYLAARERSIPTILFSADYKAVAEARDSTSDRAAAAGFAAILPKPFTLDELLDAVGTASRRSVPFDASARADRARTVELARRLHEVGATDIRTSTRREWATFRSPDDDRIYQLYWWQLLGVYMLGRYESDGRLSLVGQFFDRDAAIAAVIQEAT
ncbi:MAG: response regulator [Candidatus Limnocylindria bacterium]